MSLPTNLAVVKPAVLLAGSLLLTMPAYGEPAGLPHRIGFNDHIRPIFLEHCVACHGGPQQAGGLSLLRRESALAEADSGVAIVPGDPDASYLLDRVADPDDETRMPPPEHGRRLSPDEVRLLREWIAGGAQWQEHWSLTTPRDTPPAAESDAWSRAPLDKFVLARLTSEGLKPTPEAPREAWLRRVSFDLIGLPPTAAEIDALLADKRPDAHQRVVDRLLASPHFGERWAAVWLDLARYADTVGYERDPHRDIWPYRDWLIRAFNDDKPYDQFLVAQLAGDLLPGRTLDDRLATAFHRNTQTNTEGGTDDEEFRIAAVIDRVNTTWQALQGVTFGCAQCHDHPYDAFTTEDYYRYFAFFNSTRDADLRGDTPTLATPFDPGDFQRAHEIDNQIDKLRREHHAAHAALATETEQWRPLAFDVTESTGSTRLRFDAQTGELLAEGTITNKSRYTLAGPAPQVDQPVTALRIDVLPKDIEAATRTPEVGFMITRLRLFLEPPATEGGKREKPTEVFFGDAIADEPLPEWDPAESFNESNRGWGAFSRIWSPRHAIFLLDEPLTIPAGARLRFEWKQERTTDGQGAIAVRRARVAVSTDPRWQALLNEPQAVARLDRITELRSERKKIHSVSVPVMAARDPDFDRRTFVFERGAWLSKGKEVSPGTPASMPPLVRPNERQLTRLDLAEWIASPDNPLTSRTMVNRVWSELFGLGLVETLGDLGASGTGASHAGLLDHLATRFPREHGWRLKALLKEIVLSATYRQDAAVSPELASRDPRNRLLARGPRQRLSAEMMRDQALVLSGKFSAKMFGKPVMPYQPEGLWRAAYNASKWQVSEGEDRYRRAIYTYWRRTSGYPSLLAFDTPSRELCSVQRVVTNTPLQALVTMNDPAYVELATAFGEQMAGRLPGDVRGQIAWAYRAAAGRPAATEVIDELATVYDAALERYADLPADEPPPTENAEQFARSIVASVLLNLDEVLTR